MERSEQIMYLKTFITETRFNRFISVLQNRTRYVSIVLEDVFQGHNASAVLRSCDCFGIQDVYLIENRNSFKVNDEVAMGSSQWLSIYRYKEPGINNTSWCFDTLKKRGYRIVGTSPHAKAVSIQELSIDTPLALVFGAEKEGLSEYAMRHVDESVYIPMYGFTESFNISVSAALCMYELSRRLRASDIDYHLSENEKEGILLEWLKHSIPDAERILERMNTRTNTNL